MFTPEMLLKDKAIKAKAQALEKLRQPLPDNFLRKDVAFNPSNSISTTSDSQIQYGVLDTSPKRPTEMVVRIPIGQAGFQEAYYDPMTRVCRPIPLGV